jgi:glycosyltransferase involved in cell wall biosynthesis
MREISCIICAYNEGDRIKAILEAVDAHPALKEVIVVNDGSTDDTAALVRAHPDVRVVSYSANRGKTYAMAKGISAALGDHLMFLDADLAGLGPKEIDMLAGPVAGGRVQTSISLRRNSLGFYRMFGLDFVSGERVIPAWLVRDHVPTLETLPRWGGEAFINQLIIDAKLPIEIVDWPAVSNVRKYQKVGRIRGFLAELRMVDDALQVLSPLGFARQYLGLLNLVVRPHRALPKLRLPSPWRTSASLRTPESITVSARRGGAGSAWRRWVG